ncbi:MAG TPA: glycoside hydrolase family 15 protein [Thermoanaerobaculia bacterium]|nr:glycoside hydrolase family 15 protein [Thermoanaerobaculia bacterium]
MRAPASDRYPPIADYGLIGDCHSLALVSRCGSIDWCCMPRLDSPSSFGRLLDWEKGGCFRIAPSGEGWQSERSYLGDSLVLETRFRTATGEARLVDAFAMKSGGREAPRHQLLRVLECTGGKVDLEVELLPRFEYGAAKPWIRCHGEGFFTAIGGSSGLVITTDLPLQPEASHGLCGCLELAAGERRRVSLAWEHPNHLHPGEPKPRDLGEVDGRLEETLRWWERWVASRAGDPALRDPAVLRSAVVLKGLIFAPTGAIAAAATTSLPEAIGGTRNWDYRMSWIRDSSFALDSLSELGFYQEAMGFTWFIERSTAGIADEVQPMYGIDGRQLLPEIELAHLEGYRGSRPVRLGNAASQQLQLDGMGQLVDLAWNRLQRGETPDPAYVAFLVGVVEAILAHWREPDFGIWEMRRQPLHFVHSQVMCWAAVDRGIAVVEKTGALLHQETEVPLGRWRAARDELRAAIETKGYDREHGVFVQAFENRELDAALLLLPKVGFVAYDDPRMVRTTDAIARRLRRGDALVRRYTMDDGLPDDEGCFVACSFWLVQCLALQGKRDEAAALFDAACGLANDLGLFAEEHDGEQMLGNFPQGLSHYSHIAAAVALREKKPTSLSAKGAGRRRPIGSALSARGGPADR